MKKNILTAIIIIASITAVKAQDIRFGAKGGVNFSDLYINIKSGSISREIETEMNTSFNIGGFIEFPFSSFSDKFYGEVGLSYSSNGATTKTSNLNMSIDQLNLPVTLKYEAIDNLFLNGGIYLSYIISVEAKNNRNGKIIQAEKDFEKIDMGLIIGAEYNLDNGLLFYLNYNYGLLNIAKKKDNSSTEPKVKNRVFQVGLGYKF